MANLDAAARVHAGRASDIAPVPCALVSFAVRFEPRDATRHDAGACAASFMIDGRRHEHLLIVVGPVVLAQGLALIRTIAARWIHFGQTLSC